MNLSVESRVKAHISTAYINADGRGTESAMSSDFADCMKSPTEFAQIQAGHSKDEELLKQMETDHAAAVARFNDMKASIDHREHVRQVKRAQEAGELTTAHVSQREVQREVDREAHAAALDQAYHKRNTSEEAMEKFRALSRPSLETQVRDREENVRSRYQQLKDKAAAAKAIQRQTIEEQQQRAVASAQKQEEELAEKLRLLQEKEEAEMKLRAQKELAQIKLERERAARLQREEDEIKRAAEIELRQYEVAHEAAVERERAATALRVEKEKQMHNLAIEQSEHQTEADYAHLKHLQIQFETNANDIKDSIQKTIGTGSHLNILMEAAKVQANEKHTTFVGLSLLSQATFTPSVLSPSAAPTPEGPRERTISVQTLISEPVRPPKQKRL